MFGIEPKVDIPAKFNNLERTLSTTLSRMKLAYLRIHDIALMLDFVRELKKKNRTNVVGVWLLLEFHFLHTIVRHDKICLNSPLFWQETVFGLEMDRVSRALRGTD